MVKNIDKKSSSTKSEKKSKRYAKRAHKLEEKALKQIASTLKKLTKELNEAWFAAYKTYDGTKRQGQGVDEGDVPYVDDISDTTHHQSAGLPFTRRMDIIHAIKAKVQDPLTINDYDMGGKFYSIFKDGDCEKAFKAWVKALKKADVKHDDDSNALSIGLGIAGGLIVVGGLAVVAMMFCKSSGGDDDDL
jgi:hypothetical protein